jgi:D-alanyl-lipoteichoic acid acyltransferase DltB (MBOAT superfamily)
MPTARPDSFRSTGLYPGEPVNCRRSIRGFISIFTHLVALVLIFGVYRLEGRAFQMLAQITAISLPIHYLLPYRYKKPFLVAISIFGLVGVFGAIAAAAVLSIAAALIAICYLPISWRARVGMIGLAAIALAFGRVGRIAPDLPETVWPVLGSMFMFRMILYLYEIKHATKKEKLLDTVGYFFLLPNYAFMHFPVVDYRTLLRGYYSQDIHATSQAGLRMLFRGAMHLLAYRLIYHEVLITPAEVVSLPTLMLFVVTNYLLYLHVSGQFHMACGLLHMFGYSLPETHHNYLLASGFTDYWRRINIYWKDFMVRVVFNPVAFRLKRRPQWISLSVATTAVFITTWFLHAYQSFWIRGTWAFSWHDSLFWGILGILVLVNVQVDARTPVRRTLGSKSEISLTRNALAIRSAKTLATFTTIALLWSLWTSASVHAWLMMLARAF